MVVFTVHIHIRPEAVETFQALCLANAVASRKEPGCVRFEVLQQEDDPTRFVLFEAWADGEAQAAHRTTPHYATWKEQTEGLQEESRQAVRYRALTSLPRCTP